MKPIYQLVRKATTFEWGSDQQNALRALQWATQVPLPHLSYRSQQPPSLPNRAYGKNTTIGQSAHWAFKLNLLESGKKYTAFERQLWACCWALVNTEPRIHDYKLFLRPKSLIMIWVWMSLKSLGGGSSRISHCKQKRYYGSRHKQASWASVTPLNVLKNVLLPPRYLALGVSVSSGQRGVEYRPPFSHMCLDHW